MAKAKAPAKKSAPGKSAPAQKQKVFKVKGPVPDYKTAALKKTLSEAKKIDPTLTVKNQNIHYYGENRVVGFLVLTTRDRIYDHTFSEEMAWECAKECVGQFVGAGRDMLYKLADSVLKEGNSVVNSYELTKLENRQMGYQLTAGIFQKRILFWFFIKAIGEDRIPEGIPEYTQLPFGEENGHLAMTMKTVSQFIAEGVYKNTAATLEKPAVNKMFTAMIVGSAEGEYFSQRGIAGITVVQKESPDSKVKCAVKASGKYGELTAGHNPAETGPANTDAKGQKHVLRNAAAPVKKTIVNAAPVTFEHGIKDTSSNLSEYAYSA